MASFTDSFGQPGDESRPSAAASTCPFDEDDYLGYDPRLASQRFDSFTNFADFESVKESVEDSPIYNSASYAASDDVFTSQPIPDTPSPPSIYVSGGGFAADQHEFSSFSPEANGKVFDEGFSGPILRPPTEMQADEGFSVFHFFPSDLRGNFENSCIFIVSKL